jgi:hypothetical protein
MSWWLIIFVIFESGAGTVFEANMDNEQDCYKSMVTMTEYLTSDAEDQKIDKWTVLCEERQSGKEQDKVPTDEGPGKQ